MTDAEVIARYRSNVNEFLNADRQQQVIDTTFNLGAEGLKITDYMKLLVSNR